MIDTHAHLYAEEFDKDRDEVVNRAKESGLTHILLPAIDSGTYSSMLSTVETYSFCYPMIGLHPCYVKEKTWKQELEFVKQKYLENKNLFVAVGEIGLDLYWDTSTLDIQRIAFIQQLEWASEWNLPVVIHARESLNLVISILQDFKKLNYSLRGVCHCFTGSESQAKEITEELDFYIGIGGVLTYKKSGLDLFLKSILKEKILLETDAPYLSPVPHRGKRNEPTYTTHIAQKLSTLWGVNFDEVINITSQNAFKLFNLK